MFRIERVACCYAIAWHDWVFPGKVSHALRGARVAAVGASMAYYVQCKLAENVGALFQFAMNEAALKALQRAAMNTCCSKAV